MSLIAPWLQDTIHFTSGSRSVQLRVSQADQGVEIMARVNRREVLAEGEVQVVY